ncbi:MAG: TIM barrel protein [Nitrososphaeria archaeon]
MVFTIQFKKDGLCFSSNFPWRLGIVLFMAYPSLQKSEEELEKAINFLTLDNFFDRLEVQRISDLGWKKIEKHLENVEIARAFQPDILAGKNLSAVDESKRQEAVQYVKSEMDVWLKRGVKQFAVCSGHITTTMEEGKKQFVKSIKEIAEYALNNCAVISVETFDIDKDKKQVIGPVHDAAKLVKEIREEYPNVFLMWDQSHAPLLDEKPEVLKEYADILGVIHIGCGLKAKEGLLDWHPVYHTPGALNDENDLAQLFNVLLDIGYCGPVTVEIKPQEGQTSEEVINSAKGAIYTAYSLAVKKLL